MYPFHSDSDRNFHAYLGLYIGCWSSFECTLYELIRSLRLLQREDMPPKAIPFKNKIKLIKKHFSSNAALISERDEALAICRFAEDEADFRHNLIHGVNVQIYKHDPWHALMLRPEITTDLFNNPDAMHVTEQDLETHYHEVGLAGFAVVRLNGIVLEIIERDLKQKLAILQQQSSNQPENLNG